MATVKQNNIQFSVNKVKFGKSGTFGNSANDDFTMVGDEKIPVKPFVNAVEIDWNGAQIGES